MLDNKTLYSISKNITCDHPHLQITQEDLLGNLIAYRDDKKQNEYEFYRQLHEDTNLTVHRFFEFKALLAYTSDEYIAECIENDIDLTIFFDNIVAEVDLSGIKNASIALLTAVGGVSIIPFITSTLGVGFKSILALGNIGILLSSAITTIVGLAVLWNRDIILYQFLKLLKSIGSIFKELSLTNYFVEAYKTKSVLDDLEAMDLKSCATKCGLPEIPTREIFQQMQFVKKEGKLGELVNINRNIREDDTHCVIHCILDFVTTLITGLAITHKNCIGNSKEASSKLSTVTNSPEYTISPDCNFIAKRNETIKGTYRDFLEIVFKHSDNKGRDIREWMHILDVKVEAALANKPITSYHGSAKPKLKGVSVKDFELHGKVSDKNNSNRNNFPNNPKPINRNNKPRQPWSSQNSSRRHR